MFDASGTLALLDALERRPSSEPLERLLQRPDLSRMFPALGVSNARGLGYLHAYRDGRSSSELDEGGALVANYFGELLSHRSEFEALVAQLAKDGPELLRAAYRRTQEFLPEGSELGCPRLVFLPIGYDFRTDEETVHADPMMSLLVGSDELRDTLSHELHHVGRFRRTHENLTLMREDARGPPADSVAALARWAGWLELEGIADCAWSMTQGRVPLLAEARAERRQRFETYGATVEGEMAALQGPPTRPGDPSESPTERFARLRPLAHPTGHRLATEIEGAFGRRALVECVGRPGQFLATYNRVASQKGLVEFDRAVLAALPV